jgi:cytochrome c oxidase cbb3-type subunit 3
MLRRAKQARAAPRMPAGIDPPASPREQWMFRAVVSDNRQRPGRAPYMREHRAVMSSRVSLAVAAALLLLAACEREERQSRPRVAPTAEAGGRVAESAFVMGPGAQVWRNPQDRDYEHNAYLLAEGKSLFERFNCTGCHFNGGGGIGPALMDDHWLYGSSIEEIAASIREGRPNGMPSFRDHVPDYEIWQLAGYVRSMAGNLSKAAAPSRNDDIQSRPAESRMRPPPPVTTSVPRP